MTNVRHNPAVYAGLLGVAMSIFPTSAMALPLESMLSNTAAPYVQFTLGVIAGVALSTAAHIVMDANRAQGMQEQGAEELPADEGARQQRAKGKYRRLMAPKSSHDWEVADSIRVQELNDDPLAQLVAQQGQARADEGSDNVAEVTESHPSLRERISARSSEVSSAIAAHFGDPFEGLPIIERADGTVGDVGTGWWDQTLGSSILRVDEFNTGEIDADEIFRRIEAIPSDAPMPKASNETENTGAVAQAEEQHIASSSEQFDQAHSASRRADYISKNVNEVNVGVFPEHRTVADLEREDMWEMALKAMDERLDGQSGYIFSSSLRLEGLFSRRASSAA